MLIFSLALIFVGRFLEGAVRMNNVADRNTQATQFAQERFEIFKSSTFTSLANGTATKPGGYTLSWNFTPDPATGPFRSTCSLTVQWADMTHNYAVISGHPRPQNFKKAVYVFQLTRPRM